MSDEKLKIKILLCNQVTGILRHELMEFMFEDPEMLVSKFTDYTSQIILSFSFETLQAILLQ